MNVVFSCLNIWFSSVHVLCLRVVNVDVLKDISEAMSQRIRSPFLGSILLVFAALNWKPIWYLLFADKPVFAKFLYIEANTDPNVLYFWPVVGGIILAIAMPWITLVGAYVAAKPRQHLNEFQLDAIHSEKMSDLKRSAELEAEKKNVETEIANRVISADKSEKQAKEQGGPELVEKFRSEVAKAETATLDSAPSLTLSPKEILVLQIVNDMPNFTVEELVALPDTLVGWEDAIGEVSLQRLTTDFRTTLDSLEEKSLVSYIGEFRPRGQWQLTSEGYDELDSNQL